MAQAALVVAQSGGPTPVINASLAGVILAAREQSQISHIYGLVNGLEGAVRENLVDLNREPTGTLNLLIDTPAAALGSGRFKVTGDHYQQILRTFQKRHVRYFVHIGGNGSMHVTHRLAQAAAAQGYELAVMGVPKTIDNDLSGTDHAPGYGSAARFLALATRDTGRDLESMVNFDDLIIMETMGRNAGWLAAAAALGKENEDAAPHLVYAPEIPFDETRFLDDVAQTHRRLGRVFVVVGEGVRDASGQFIGQHGLTDPVGRMVHQLTTGVAAYLTDLVRDRLNLQSRFLRPGLIGRAFSACVSTTDRREALQAGREAVNQLMAGRSGLMVSLERVFNKPYVCQCGAVPLADVAGVEKTLPREFMNRAGNMVTPAFTDYALPLIDGPLPPLARLLSTGGRGGGL